MEFIVPNTSRETKRIIFERINRKSTSGSIYRICYFKWKLTYIAFKQRSYKIKIFL